VAIPEINRLVHPLKGVHQIEPGKEGEKMMKRDLQSGEKNIKSGF